MEGISVVRNSDVAPSFPLNYLTCFNLRRGWQRRRFAWRYVYMYRRMSVLLLVITIWCFIFTSFVTDYFCTAEEHCGRFVNHSCAPGAIEFYRVTTLVVAIFSILMAVVSLSAAQILSMFVHTSIRDFEKAGWLLKMFSRLSKIAPWVVSIFFIFWLITILIPLIGAFARPCHRRFNSLGIDAVLLCRMYHVACCNNGDCSPGFTAQGIQYCNDLKFLIQGEYVGREQHTVVCPVSNYNPVAIPKTISCTDVDTCPAFEEGTSDLARFGLLTVLITTVGAVVMTVTLLVVRAVTPIESQLYIPATQNDSFVKRWLRLFTPW